MIAVLVEEVVLMAVIVVKAVSMTVFVMVVLLVLPLLVEVISLQPLIQMVLVAMLLVVQVDAPHYYLYPLLQHVYSSYSLFALLHELYS